MSATNIEWTQNPDGSKGKTWNPVRGCSIVSAGCKNCYAMKQAHRFSGPGNAYAGLTQLSKRGPVWTGDVRFVHGMLDAPLRWTKPARVFVNSMSDLFHESLPDEQIDRVFAIMQASPMHTFQVLTKRAERMRAYFTGGAEERVRDACEALAAERGWCHAHEDAEWPLPNVWLGVSAEDQDAANERIPHLQQTPAAVRFVSAEPLLGPIEFDADWLLPRCIACGRHSARGLCCEHEPHCTGGTVHSRQEQAGLIDWVIVGGESGHGARGCDLEWIRSIVRQCRDSKVACFVKQLGKYPYEQRRAQGGVHGTDEALANFGSEHPQRQWFPSEDGWCLTHLHDGTSWWRKNWHRRLKDKKGGDMQEWPQDLRVREMPEVRHG